jgi:hypothetical protein
MVRNYTEISGPKEFIKIIGNMAAFIGVGVTFKANLKGSHAPEFETPGYFFPHHHT